MDQKKVGNKAYLPRRLCDEFADLFRLDGAVAKESALLGD
jgi:hypothetical protein